MRGVQRFVRALASPKPGEDRPVRVRHGSQFLLALEVAKGLAKEARRPDRAERRTAVACAEDLAARRLLAGERARCWRSSHQVRSLIPERLDALAVAGDVVGGG